MTTHHFNGLTEDQQERLVILAEECAEVQQAVCKILRHGYASTNPTVEGGETNREMLMREIGDMLHVVDRMVIRRDIDQSFIRDRAESKSAKIVKYLHHQHYSSGRARYRDE